MWCLGDRACSNTGARRKSQNPTCIVEEQQGTNVECIVRPFLCGRNKHVFVERSSRVSFITEDHDLRFLSKR